jgi:hypothetical protein
MRYDLGFCLAGSEKTMPPTTTVGRQAAGSFRDDDETMTPIPNALGKIGA